MNTNLRTLQLMCSVSFCAQLDPTPSHVVGRLFEFFTYYIVTPYLLPHNLRLLLSSYQLTYFVIFVLEPLRCLGT
jgi:hypothetical protein